MDEHQINMHIQMMELHIRRVEGFRKYVELKRLLNGHIPKPTYALSVSLEVEHNLKEFMRRKGITEEMRLEKSPEYIKFLRDRLRKEMRDRITYGRQPLFSTLFRIKCLPWGVAYERKLEDSRKRALESKCRNRPYLFEKRVKGQPDVPKEAVFHSRSEYMVYVNSVLSMIEHISQLKRAFEWKGRKLTKEWVLQIALDEAMESVLELLKPTSLPEDFGQRRLKRARNQAKREEIKKEIEEVRERIEKKMKKWSLEPAAHDA